MNGIPSPRAALAIGLALGLALGLAYTWLINPVELVNTYPALLRTDYRHDWVRLAALSYVNDGNLARARTRLEDLKQEDIAEALKALIEEKAASGSSAETLRRLTRLAQALDVHTPAMLVYQHTPGTATPFRTSTPAPTPSFTPTRAPTATSTPTSTPVPTPTTRRPSPLSTPTPELTGTLPSPTPTLTLTPTPTPPLLDRLRMVEREQLCQPEQEPHIEVIVKDERDDGVAGTEIWLTWPDGADRAVTGLTPQQGPGYADFNVDEDVTYSISVGELGRPLITNIQLEPCPPAEAEDDEPILGSWRFVLAPPTEEE